MSFDPLRYDRQIRIPDFGEEAQAKLRRAKAVVFGVGGLGCVSSTYLAAAGVGKLVLVDSGYVELSNLNRQLLYTLGDLGKPKALAAEKRVAEINPEVAVEGVQTELVPDEVDRLVKNASVVVDGLDTYEARHVVNKFCVSNRVAFIHGAVEGFRGQVTSIVPGETPCLRCMFPEKVPRPEVIPIIGATCAVIGGLQALEAIKLVTGFGQPLLGKLLLIDCGLMEFEEVELARRPNCPVCSGLRTI